MSTKQQTSAQLLKAAKRRIQTHGWAKATFGPTQGPNCAVGLLDRVYRHTPDAANHQAADAFHILGFLLGAEEEGIQDICVTDYNDAPSTTQADIEQLFTASIEVARTLGV